MLRTDSASKLKSCVDLWRLEDAEAVAETATSWVYRVMQRGQPMALKILKPEHKHDERRGAALLAWYAGTGAAVVFEATEDACLIEWLDGPPLSTMVHDGEDLAATDIACTLVQQLHADRSESAPVLLPLGERFSALFETDRSLWPPAGHDLMIRAQGVARRLLETTFVEVPLHGDLHHDNILAANGDWKAIDPKGLFGDPAYEVANMFINPGGALDICADGNRIAQMTNRFASALNLDRNRILGFAAAHAALSISWSIKDNTPFNQAMAVLPKLLSAYELAAND